MRSIIMKMAWLAKQKGLKQSDLAHHCAVSRVTINRFFNDRSELRASDFCKLLEALGVNLEEQLLQVLQSERLWVINEHQEGKSDTTLTPLSKMGGVSPR